MDKHLHIVSFTVPYPADYGGVFDLYYKIRALHEAGVHIHLHCFTSGREEPTLNNYCAKVYYYQRQTGIRGMSLRLPYIVSSRSSPLLVERLAQDEHPILIEGIHSSFLLTDDRFIGRKTALRLHNLEHIYYRQLFASSTSILKKIYYKTESALLDRYESEVIDKAGTIFSVSSEDAMYCREFYHAENVNVLPVFTGFPYLATAGTGCFCLYHGNLSVPENEKMVLWLLHEVFANLDVPFIIAGRNPAPVLTRAVSRYANASLISNPGNDVLQDLLVKAQCHVLPSANATGVKLKLIHALHTGRHCIVNQAAVVGSDLEPLCHVADTADTFTECVRQLYRTPVSEDVLDKRKEILGEIFDIKRQTQQLIQWLS